MDMTQCHGVDTAVEGVCAACSKPIPAKVVNSLWRQWDTEHFTHASCDIDLYTLNNLTQHCQTHSIYLEDIPMSGEGFQSLGF